MNNKILKEYEAISLSDKDIFKLLNDKVKIVLYPNLVKYKTIDEVLGKYGVCVLLFEARKRYGHWCCLWKLNRDTVSFFNSYGGFPDDSLRHIPEHYAKISNQLVPYLSLLLYNSPYKLTYNDKEYQAHNSDVKTCGRHVVIRLTCKHMDDKEYEDYMNYFTKKYGINYDEMVTLLTSK